MNKDRLNEMKDEKTSKETGNSVMHSIYILVSSTDLSSTYVLPFTSSFSSYFIYPTEEDTLIFEELL